MEKYNGPTVGEIVKFRYWDKDEPTPPYVQTPIPGERLKVIKPVEYGSCGLFQAISLETNKVYALFDTEVTR